LDQEDGTNKVIILGETNHTDLAQSGWTVPFALACSDGVFSGLLVANVAGSSAMFDDFDHFPTLPLGIQTRTGPMNYQWKPMIFFGGSGRVSEPVPGSKTIVASTKSISCCMASCSKAAVAITSSAAALFSSDSPTRIEKNIRQAYRKQLFSEP
jgi:hypothetical protein